MSFFAHLEIRARELDTLLCVGSDPHSQDLAPQPRSGPRLLPAPDRSHRRSSPGFQAQRRFL